MRSRNAQLRFQLDTSVKACVVRSYHRCLSHGKSRGRNEHAWILMLLTHNEIYFSQLTCSFILLNLSRICEKANPHFLFFLHLSSLKLCWYCLNDVVWISYSFFRTPFNWLLVNLAIADITFAVFQVPNHILTFTPSDVTIGSALCKVLTAGNVAWVGAAAGTITLVVIAFERYYTIRFPVSGKGKLTKNTVKVTE